MALNHNRGTSMYIKSLKSFAAVAAVLLLTGFGSGTPVYNVTSSFPVSPTATLEGLERAIMRGGILLGWDMQPVGPGKVQGILNIRTHRAVIDITYDIKSFSITYKDSVNLDYRASDNTIHSNYNGWIQRLERNIRAQALN